MRSNHEFDYGAAGLRRCIDASNFRWFGSNVVQTGSEKLIDGVTDTLVSMMLLPVRGPNGDIHLTQVKVGVFGVCTQSTPTLSYPGNDIAFTNVVECAQKRVASLKKQGAQVIIALTHVCLQQDKLIARQVHGIDVVLGGHDHTPYALMEGEALVFKCGQDSEWLGIVDLDLTVDEDNDMSVHGIGAW